MSPVLPDTRAMNVSEAAAAWCALGWRVVPVGQDKRPLCKWKDAAPETPAQALARFNGMGRGTGLAIALPAAVMVVDIDHRPAHGWDGALILAALTARFDLPDAPMAATPSGGRHVWLALPDGARVRNSTSQASPLAMDGVDVRTAGGLIIVPPTERKDSAYQWLHWQSALPLAPAALVEALQPKTPSPPSAPPRPFHGGPLSPYAEAVLRRELESVSGSLRGGRNDALAAVRATIASGWRRGLATPRTLKSGVR